jgi:hypothetical protein
MTKQITAKGDAIASWNKAKGLSPKASVPVLRGVQAALRAARASFASARPAPAGGKGKCALVISRGQLRSAESALGRARVLGGKATKLQDAAVSALDKLRNQIHKVGMR